MVNREKILEKTDLIYKSLQRLKELVTLTESRFYENPDNFAIAEHHLRRSLESLFDIGRHIMAKKGLGHPTDYRSIITAMAGEGVIPVEFADKVKGMAGYRNRLVHGYAEVTSAEMYNLISNRLNDFELFCKYVLLYLDRTNIK